MKLNLVVMTSGNTAGKVLNIPVSKFLIGREPGCHLRPASSLVSKRHCAVLTRDSKVFIQDFNSTNGTLVNNVPVKGETELHDKDRLKIGPLMFEVRIEGLTPVSKPTPPPYSRKSTTKPTDEEAAALLLSLEEGGPAPGSTNLDSEGIPTGSTVFETGALATLPPDAPPEPPKEEPVPAAVKEEKPAEKKAEPTKPKMGDTSVAAQAILEKYLKRPRT